MSAFEQKREIPNRALQYMVVRLSFYFSFVISHAPSHTRAFHIRPLLLIGIYGGRNKYPEHVLIGSWRQSHTRRYHLQSHQKIW